MKHFKIDLLTFLLSLLSCERETRFFFHSYVHFRCVVDFSPFLVVCVRFFSFILYIQFWRRLQPTTFSIFGFLDTFWNMIIFIALNLKRHNSLLFPTLFSLCVSVSVLLAWHSMQMAYSVRNSFTWLRTWNRGLYVCIEYLLTLNNEYIRQLYSVHFEIWLYSQSVSEKNGGGRRVGVDFVGLTSINYNPHTITRKKKKYRNRSAFVKM